MTSTGAANVPTPFARRSRQGIYALFILVAACAIRPLSFSCDRLLAQSAAPAPPVVYVYLHTESKFAELERVLKTKLSGLSVTVFGRFRDLEEAMAARPPDALIALDALVSSVGFAPALRGTRANQDWEPYALVSVGDTLDSSLSGKTIGAVDLLGRDGTQRFVERMVGVPDIKVKRVTKTEDLLPLLQFSAADAVFAPRAFVKTLSDRSRLPLRVRDLDSARVKLPTVGIRNVTAQAAVTTQIKNLDPETNRTLGVELWRLP
jgi:hypothetical protein